MDATDVVRAIPVDTAQLLASRVKYETVRDDTRESATRKATSRATLSGLDFAIGRVAANWLSDVNQRGGQQVELVFHAIPFERLTQAIGKLRDVDGVRDVIVGATDAQGRSTVRVITHSSAADIAAVLVRIDPGRRVTNSTRYQVELSANSSSRSPWEACCQRLYRWLIPHGQPGSPLGWQAVRCCWYSQRC